MRESVVDKEELIRLNNLGYSYNKIADELGVMNWETIMKAFKRYGIIKNPAKHNQHNIVKQKQGKNYYNRKLKNGWYI